jgi:hypothetical protein
VRFVEVFMIREQKMDEMSGDGIVQVSNNISEIQAGQTPNADIYSMY